MRSEKSAVTGTLVAQSIRRGTVIAVQSGGVSIALDCDGDLPDLIECDILETSQSARLELAAGASVLVWQQPGPGAGRGVVMGRITEPSVPASVPDELVIEAGRSLTLRVGEGSITIRQDGRILIKGKDLVSHAKGINRIRGGAVAVN